MNISLEMIAERVAVMGGEYPDWKMAADAEGVAVSVLEMILPFVEETAVRLSLLTPYGRADTLKDLTGHMRLLTDWGSEDWAECEMPADMLRLESLQLKGWRYPLSEDRQGRRFVPRPWLEIIAPRAGGEGALLRFGPKGAAQFEHALYLPRPRLEAGELKDLPREVLQPLTEELLKIIKTSE